MSFEKDGPSEYWWISPRGRAVAPPELRATTPQKPPSDKKQTPLAAQPSSLCDAASSIRSYCFGNSSNPIPLRSFCWPSRPSDICEQRSPETALFSAPPPPFFPSVKGKCMLPGESQLAYIWAFSMRSENGHVETPFPTLVFDISLTDVILNPPVGWKNFEMSCAFLLLVSRNLQVPHDSEFDIVSKYHFRLTCKLLIVHGGQFLYQSTSF
jgi:hypothetical protein